MVALHRAVGVLAALEVTAVLATSCGTSASGPVSTMPSVLPVLPAAGLPGGSLNVLSPLNLNCTLPVIVDASPIRVRLPSGAVLVDAGATNSRLWARARASSYVAGHWLPVPSGDVSPDGRSYAYVGMGRGHDGLVAVVHVHEIASDQDEAIWTGDIRAPIEVVAWTAGGIYLAEVIGEDETPPPGPPAGLMVLDPHHPARPRSAVAGGPSDGFGWITADAAWTAEGGGPGLAPAPVPAPAPGAQPRAGPLQPPTVVRLDLHTGTTATWFTGLPGQLITILGLDQQGLPVISVRPLKLVPMPVPGTPTPASGPTGRQVLLLPAPGRSVPIADSEAASRVVSVFADTHGIWLGMLGEIRLFADGLLTRVAEVPTGSFPMPAPSVRVPPSGLGRSPAVQIAGPCG